MRQAAWTRWGFWALVIALVATLVAAAELHVARSVTGRTQGSSGAASIVMTIPAAAAKDVAAGQRVRVATSSGDTLGRVARAPAPDGTTVEVALNRALPPGATPTGRAVVQLPSRRLLVLVLPALRGLLGN
jgi:hypothetical protein